MADTTPNGLLKHDATQQNQAPTATSNLNKIDSAGARIVLNHNHTADQVEGLGGIHTLTEGSPTAINWAQARVQLLFITANRTVTLANALEGVEYILIVRQQNGGGWNITWPAAVRWPGGTAPTLSPALTATDKIRLLRIGTEYFGEIVQGY